MSSNSAIETLCAASLPSHSPLPAPTASRVVTGRRTLPCSNCLLPYIPLLPLGPLCPNSIKGHDRERDVAVLKLPLELYAFDFPLHLPLSTCLDSIKGRDRERDVAVLKLDLPADKLANLKPVRIGSSSNLLVGQKVRGDTGGRWLEGQGGSGRTWLEVKRGSGRTWVEGEVRGRR